MSRRARLAGLAVLRFVAVPWGAFTAAFLFYVAITLVAFSVEQLPDALMVAAYLAPVAAYLAVLLARLVAMVSVLARHLGHPAPVALPR